MQFRLLGKSAILVSVSTSDGNGLDGQTLEALREHAFMHGWSYPWHA